MWGFFIVALGQVSACDRNFEVSQEVLSKKRHQSEADRAGGECLEGLIKSLTKEDFEAGVLFGLARNNLDIALDMKELTTGPYDSSRRKEFPLDPTELASFDRAGELGSSFIWRRWLDNGTRESCPCSWHASRSLRIERHRAVCFGVSCRVTEWCSRDRKWRKSW